MPALIQNGGGMLLFTAFAFIGSNSPSLEEFMDVRRLCVLPSKRREEKNATFTAIKAFATCGMENIPAVAHLRCRDRLLQPHLPSTGNGMDTPHLSEVCPEDTPLPNPSQPPCWGNSSLSRHANCLHYPTPVV